MSEETNTNLSTFTDKNGNTWKMELNVGIVNQLKTDAGLDLDECIKKPEKIATILLESPVKLVSVFYVVLEEQIEKRSLSPVDFAKLFDRKLIDAATDAFIAALFLFYPRAAAGAVLADRLPAMLKSMDRQIVKKANIAVEKALSNMPMS